MDNNEAPEKKNNPNSAFDEIMNGFYDLSRLYSEDKPSDTAAQPEQTPKPESKPEADAEKPASREEELRRRDEERRRLEMQAVREDIERRYSLQLEEAKSKTEEKPPEPKKTYIEIPNGEEAVREELERIDSLIGEDVILPEPDVPLPSPVTDVREAKTKKRSKKSKPDKKEKPVEYVSDSNAVYYFIYTFGNILCKFFARIFELIFGVIRYPFAKLHKIAGAATAGTKMQFKRYVRMTLAETVYFRREIKSARKTIKKAMKKPLSLPSVLVYYVRKAIKRHKDLLKTALNILMPAAALALLILTVNYWNSVTFALEVIYNDKSIGYISDESVYIEAKDMVRDRLNSKEAAELTTAGAADFNAHYALSLVSFEDLNDARAISDKMIENSVDNLTHACGVYIDGEFICAVKNESDAKAVFYDILEPYEADAEAGGYVVGFAENIDYVQGLYNGDESIVWDASRLAATLNGDAEKQYMYTVSEDDTVSQIASKYGISESKLRADNPDINFDDLQGGEIIAVKLSSEYVSIKKTVTSTSLRDIEFDTVKQRDATKFSGYRVVQQEGVNGTERVTKTEIYINGVLDDTSYAYETIIEPIDEIVTVGTRTTYGGVYVGSTSEKGFLWPAPSCHYVSSPYGWRSSGWHNGIDLCRAGGGALGTPVIASRSGYVEVVQRSSSGYGNMVLINHGDGYKTRYAHMISGSILVSTGQYVEAGQTIGKVGSTGNSTGPHLHFEVIWQGETQNPKGYIS